MGMKYNKFRKVKNMQFVHDDLFNFCHKI
jgi:hypothetical protein